MYLAPYFCSLCLFSILLCHPHLAPLGGRLVGSPEPAEASYPSACFKILAAASLQCQIFLHVVVCAVSRTTPRLLLLCFLCFRSLREPFSCSCCGFCSFSSPLQFLVLFVSSFVFSLKTFCHLPLQLFLQAGFYSPFNLPFCSFVKPVFTDLYTSFFSLLRFGSHRYSFIIWPLHFCPG